MKILTMLSMLLWQGNLHQQDLSATRDWACLGSLDSLACVERGGSSQLHVVAPLGSGHKVLSLSESVRLAYVTVGVNPTGLFVTAKGKLKVGSWAKKAGSGGPEGPVLLRQTREMQRAPEVGTILASCTSGWTCYLVDTKGQIVQLGPWYDAGVTKSGALPSGLRQVQLVAGQRTASDVLHVIVIHGVLNGKPWSRLVKL